MDYDKLEEKITDVLEQYVNLDEIEFEGSFIHELCQIAVEYKDKNQQGYL